MKIKIALPSLSARRRTGLCLSFQVEGQVPERSIGLAWKACVGLNQPWVRIPPCPTLLRTERSAIVLRRVGGQGIHSAGRENWLGLRVTGDQSHPVRPTLRTGCLTSRRGKTARSQGNGGPIPPCPTLLRTGNLFCGTRELARSQGNGGPILPCPTYSEDREYHLPEAKSG